MSLFSGTYPLARQRADGRWDYTDYDETSKRVRPIGYCGGRGDSGEFSHRDGHETPEQARECYYRYALNTTNLEMRINQGYFDSKALDEELKNPKYPCVGLGSTYTGVTCKNKTAYQAWIYPAKVSYPLCNEHRTMEIVITLFTPKGMLDKLEFWHNKDTPEWRYQSYKPFDDKDSAFVMMDGRAG